MWLCWVVYWKIVSSGTKTAIRHESFLSRLAHLGPLFLAITLIGIPCLPIWPLDAHFLPKSFVWFWLGVKITASGLLFTVWARTHLGRNWSGNVTIKEDHELIITGPYALVRNPIYTGLLFGFIGSAVALNEWRGIMAVFITAISFWRKLKFEEKWLEQTFGETYINYKRRVSALIPFVL